jgi:DNA polymerase I
VDCQHSGCVKNRVPETDHHVCVERRGTYSGFTGALKDLRIHWYKPRARETQFPEEERQRFSLVARLLKLLSVSCYGVTVRIQGLASPTLAESITAYGRYALRRTWQIAEELGLSPKYGDTDSIFLDNASEQGSASLIHRVREALGLELAVEKRYRLCVLTSAKKAYLGIQRDGTADIKGLTMAKSNSPLFFREVLSKISQKMSGIEPPSELDEMRQKIAETVKESIDQLRSGNVRVKDLEYRVALWKEPKEKFDSHILPQAYQAAKLLQRRGKYPHKREEIAFVKVRPFKVGGRSFTVKPPDETQPNEVNTEDYVRSLLQSLRQITEPMGIDLTRYATKSLTEYM